MEQMEILLLVWFMQVYIGFKTLFYVVRHLDSIASHWPSFRFLLFMAFLIPSIQFFFGLPRALFCFGIHFNVILGNLPSTILWTWPYHVSWFCSISFTIVSSSPICRLSSELTWCKYRMSTRKLIKTIFFRILFNSSHHSTLYTGRYRAHRYTNNK